MQFVPRMLLTDATSVGGYVTIGITSIRTDEYAGAVNH